MSDTILDERSASGPALFAGPVPRVLRRREQAVVRISLVVGVLVGIAVAFVLHVITPGGTMVNIMLDPSQTFAIIPYAIFCMFFWSLAICYFRWRRFQALTRVSNLELLDQAIALLRGPRGVARLADALDDPKTAISPLLNRLRFIVDQWEITPGLQDAEIVLGNQVALTTDAVARGYSIVRVMVWALPVLGLIGTVLGIANAVGGFAHFLGQDISEVSQIRSRLVDVTAGLSFAFLITLLGLLTSLITMLISSALQNGEERLFAGVHQSIVERFLPALQEVAPPLPPSAPVPPDTNLAELLDEVCKALIREMARLAEAAVAHAAKVGDEAVKNIEQATAAMVARNASATEAAVKNIERVAGTTMAAVGETGRVAVDELRRAGTNALTNLKDAIASTTAVIVDARSAAVAEIRATGAEARNGLQQVGAAATTAIATAAATAVSEIGNVLRRPFRLQVVQSDDAR